jgi:hypothetical protein
MTNEQIPFVGPSYQLDDLKADCQRTVNMFVIKNEAAGGKSQMYLESVAGLTVFSEPAEMVPGWNTENEVGTWTFTNSDFTGELIS